MDQGVRKGMKPLELIDLSKSRSVGQIVDAMSRSSFGARMLGEMAATLYTWIGLDILPDIVYDGKRDTPLGYLVQKMVDMRWFRMVLTPEEYIGRRGRKNGNILVVGGFSERHADKLYQKAARAIFVNQEKLAKPGQIRDGFFPDAVFADPRFILPMLTASLLEQQRGTITSVEALMIELNGYGGVASEVSRGARTFSAMVEDPDCTVCLTLSGAMTIAKYGLVVCDMIDHKMVQYIASTGALMAHGLVESVGLKHYKYDPSHDDQLLADQHINRVTDTLEPEENLDQVADVMDEVLGSIDGANPICSSELNRLIGAHLAEKYQNARGILKSAFEKGVPVVVPAVVDSEVGNDVYVHNLKRNAAGRSRIIMDQERDSQLLVGLATEAKKLGIFTIGGGVPRNNTQNVAPLIEIVNGRLGTDLPMRMFSYGCRICPDDMHYGHLSGCTYNEGGSWRKFDLANGMLAEVHADATQVWALYVRGQMDRMERG